MIFKKQEVSHDLFFITPRKHLAKECPVFFFTSLSQYCSMSIKPLISLFSLKVPQRDFFAPSSLTTDNMLVSNLSNIKTSIQKSTQNCPRWTSGPFSVH